MMQDETIKYLVEVVKSWEKQLNEQEELLDVHNPWLAKLQLTLDFLCDTRITELEDRLTALEAKEKQNDDG